MVSPATIQSIATGCQDYDTTMYQGADEPPMVTSIPAGYSEVCEYYDPSGTYDIVTFAETNSDTWTGLITAGDCSSYYSPHVIYPSGS